MRLWNMDTVLLCKGSSQNNLLCPLNCESGVAEKAYEAVLSRLIELKKLGILPKDILCNSNELTVEECMNKEARWHKECYDKVSVRSLQRARIII